MRDASLSVNFLIVVMNFKKLHNYKICICNIVCARNSYFVPPSLPNLGVQSVKSGVQFHLLSNYRSLELIRVTTEGATSLDRVPVPQTPGMTWQAIIIHCDNKYDNQSRVQSPSICFRHPITVPSRLFAPSCGLHL